MISSALTTIVKIHILQEFFKKTVVTSYHFPIYPHTQDDHDVRPESNPHINQRSRHDAERPLILAFVRHYARGDHKFHETSQ